jgi:hypothetical protein
MSRVGLGRIQDFTARCRSDAGCLAIGKESWASGAIPAPLRGATVGAARGSQGYWRKSNPLRSCWSWKTYYYCSKLIKKESFSYRPQSQRYSPWLKERTWLAGSCFILWSAKWRQYNNRVCLLLPKISATISPFSRTREPTCPAPPLAASTSTSNPLTCLPTLPIILSPCTIPRSWPNVRSSPYWLPTSRPLSTAGNW